MVGHKEDWSTTMCQHSIDQLHFYIIKNHIKMKLTHGDFYHSKNHIYFMYIFSNSAKFLYLLEERLLIAAQWAVWNFLWVCWSNLTCVIILFWWTEDVDIWAICSASVNSIFFGVSSPHQSSNGISLIRVVSETCAIALVQAGMQANQFAYAINHAANITNFTKNHAGKGLYFFSRLRGELNF